jgi:hypothetical protein
MGSHLDKNTMKEAQKAETKLRRIERAGERAQDAVRSKWESKREEFIATLPVQVRSVLRAGGVLPYAGTGTLPGILDAGDDLGSEPGDSRPGDSQSEH